MIKVINFFPLFFLVNPASFSQEFDKIWLPERFFLSQYLKHRNDARNFLKISEISRSESKNNVYSKLSRVLKFDELGRLVLEEDLNEVIASATGKGTTPIEMVQSKVSIEYMYDQEGRINKEITIEIINNEPEKSERTYTYASGLLLKEHVQLKPNEEVIIEYNYDQNTRLVSKITRTISTSKFDSKYIWEERSDWEYHADQGTYTETQSTRSYTTVNDSIVGERRSELINVLSIKLNSHGNLLTFTKKIGDKLFAAFNLTYDTAGRLSEIEMIHERYDGPVVYRGEYNREGLLTAVVSDYKEIIRIWQYEYIFRQ